MSTQSIAVRKPELITKDWEGKTFTFRGDGYFNMTLAAKAFGKLLPNFRRSPETIDYCHELSKAVNSTPLLDVTKGRYGATWAHPKLAVFFSRWLDVRFSVACDMMIDDILKGVSTVTIEKPEESSQLDYLRSQTEIHKGLLSLIAQQTSAMALTT